MMTYMQERLAGKIGNANNIGFMLRKLFKMYDTAGTAFYAIVTSSCVQLLMMKYYWQERQDN